MRTQRHLRFEDRVPDTVELTTVELTTVELTTVELTTVGLSAVARVTVDLATA